MLYSLYDAGTFHSYARPRISDVLTNDRSRRDLTDCQSTDKTSAGLSSKVLVPSTCMVAYLI